MRDMKIDENLVQWVDSFMRDRKVILNVDGQEDEPRAATTGLPQGMSVSPACLSFSIATIFHTYSPHFAQFLFKKHHRRAVDGNLPYRGCRHHQRVNFVGFPLPVVSAAKRH